MANIIRAGGGNPSIAEIWMSQGSFNSTQSITNADCLQKYSVSEGNKISAMNFPSIWSNDGGTLSVSFTPTVKKIHCVILPYCQPSKISIVSSTAEYEKIGEYKSTHPGWSSTSTGFEVIFKNMTVGKSYSIAMSFSFRAILGVIMIVYDD